MTTTLFVRSRHTAALFTLSPMLLLAACGGKGGAPAATVEPGVEVATENITVVDSAQVESGPTLSGSLQPERAAQLRAQVAGTVLALYVEEGATVAAGSPVAMIDTTAIAESVRSARSLERSAVSAFEMATRNEERSTALHKAGAIADRDLETAHSMRLSAEANVADAKSRVASAEKQMTNATLRAPFAGVVSERPVSAGDVVQVGGAIATVVDPSLLKLEASVAAENAGSMKAGAKVAFSVNGYPARTFHGTIARINPAVDPVTRQIRLYVQVPNADHALAAGLFAEGRVAVTSAHGLAVPLSAIDAKATITSVKRLRGGKVESVPVTLGIRDELAMMVEVTKGLTRGDTLLVGSALGTPVGAPVRITRGDN
jgi:membrane fusion protein, multidrug efflux system